MRTWHAGRILFALARYLDWNSGRMMPEIEIDGFRDDLVMVSKHGYVTSYEIKISRADWCCSKEKMRFERWRKRKYLSRFFYVVPLDLYAGVGIPEFVPDDVGIITVKDEYPAYDVVREERPAVRYKTEKLPEAKISKIMDAGYYRFWNLTMALQRQRLFDRPRVTEITKGICARCGQPKTFINGVHACPDRVVAACA